MSTDPLLCSLKFLLINSAHFVFTYTSLMKTMTTVINKQKKRKLSLSTFHIANVCLGRNLLYRPRLEEKMSRERTVDGRIYDEDM